MTVFKELKRRNVFKVATAYLITAWLIIQIVTVLEPHLKLPEWVTPVIIVFLVVGFPIACLFAWAFELTPEGIKRSKDVIVDDSISTITGRKLDFGIIAAMAIAVVFLTYEAYFSEDIQADKVAESSSTQTNPNTQQSTTALSEQVTSIAVLPFVNMSNDPEQEYFSDGLSEELLNVLARIKQLKVAARTSSFFFKNKNMDIKEIASKLDVEHVLEGSVRKSGTKLRVTAQLIQADSGYHLWSETYDYEIDDVFKIQDEISAEVVKQLKVTLLNEQLTVLTEHGTKNPDAQDAYLLGRYHMQARTPESLEKAANAFKKSLAIDSNNQLSISGLVDTYALQVSYSELSLKDFESKAELLLTPYFDNKSNSAEMLTSIGEYYYRLNKIDQAQVMYKQAIVKNTNYAQAYHWLGVSQTWDFIQGIEDKDNLALSNFEKALSLDPYSSVILSNLYKFELMSGRILDAENYLNRMLEVAPNSARSNSIAVYHFWNTGRNWKKAWEIANSDNVEKAPFFLRESFYFFLALDQYEEALNIYQNLKNTSFNPSELANMYYSLGCYQINSGKITKQGFIDQLKDFMQGQEKEEVQWLLAEAYMLDKKYEHAVNVILDVYPQLLDESTKLDFYLIDATYLLLALRKLEDPRSEGLKVKIAKIIKNLDNNNLNDLQVNFMVSALKSAFGDNDGAVDRLESLYIEHNSFANIEILRHFAIFEELQHTEKFNNITLIAEQKLARKVAEFKQQLLLADADENQAIYNTQ
ncbi:hypothetical protein RI845_03690 [Thalassotalea nanhaiensis]|uniref:Tetratricopeptide repeat protein n=1 Tax=Thalassotalea nanhaiensis TaxID=3065648 RepID=A0ABY9TKH9_9GAMM|nr:hypothetical protein RI845_03690 [Colwelliaceae bacterium SQ345]